MEETYEQAVTRVATKHDAFNAAQLVEILKGQGIKREDLDQWMKEFKAHPVAVSLFRNTVNGQIQTA